MKTFRLRSGDLVTSKDGERPTTYANRTQPERAAAGIPGAAVIQRGRVFYVRLCTHNSMIERPNDAQHAWQCADCGHVYDTKETH